MQPHFQSYYGMTGKGYSERKRDIGREIYTTELLIITDLTRHNILSL